MNTTISVTKSLKSKDNRLILSDYDSFAWAKSFLSASEINFLKSASKNEVPSVFLPREAGACIIQFLKKEENIHYSREEARIAGNEILTTLAHYKIKSIVISNHCKENRVIEFVEGMALGNYQFLKYFKDKKEKTNCLKEIRLEPGLISPQALKELKAVLEATCNARDLVNEPQSYLSARRLANEIVGFGKKYGFKVDVFDKKKIERLKMGGVLAVNKGSIAPPTFSVLEWKPAKAKNKKPIVLVGKGIVYDLSLIHI